MKASLYLHYTTRSLVRGGQRTLLAVFCVAVGVMSIVALQLVGFMLQDSVTSNVRDSNGGDVSVSALSAPLHASDLAFFDRLKRSGTITNYTAVSVANGGLKAVTPSYEYFQVEAVDPQHYPLVTPPTFTTPANGTIANLLTNNQVVVTQSFLDRYGKKVGDSFTVYTKTSSGMGRTLAVTLAGVIANSGSFAQASNLLLISAQDYAFAASSIETTYSIVDVTTTNAVQAASAAQAISKQFPLAATQTVADVLKTQQATVDNISKFLEIAGLLALLVGGVGIVNTMQVLLSRRKTEIAMLKTAGYHRMDLYMLFGLEAGLLGLIGGVVGALAAIGVSAIVRLLLMNLGTVTLFELNPWIIAGGILVGFCSALIFGLLPIVQAANVRPLSVIRELPERRSAGSTSLAILLLALFSLLFCAMAVVLLNNDVLLGIGVVYGTFAFLLVLGALFSLVMFVVSKLPVPERFSLGYAALVLAGLVVSVLLSLWLPVFGLLLLLLVLIGVVFSIAPRSWKVSLKMALRNIGRRVSRTTMTAIALFVGIFSIGLVVALGQDLQAGITQAFSQQEFNIIAVTSGDESTALHNQLTTIPGLTHSNQDVFTSTIPIAVNDTPLQQILAGNARSQEALSFLGSLEGYDLTTTTPSLKLTQGRNLNASDMGTNNIVVIDQLSSTGSDGTNLKPGDTVTFMSVDGKTSQKATIVGIYTGAVSVSHVGMVIAPEGFVKELSPAKTGAASVTYMKIDPAQVNHALDAIGTIAPNATVQNVADVITGFTQQLSSFLDVLVAIASLSMLAGVIIIANSVTLAMLERRRELGILKSVGYTSGIVLREVLIENGIVAAIGSIVAMLLAALGVALLGSLLFNLTLSITPWVVGSLVGGTVLLAMLVAALVAWGAVRVRPLAVLRYE